RLPALAHPAQRALEAIGILVEIAQRDGLGAHVAAAEGIVVVAADRGDAAAGLEVDADPAHRLAERARTKVGRHARTVYRTSGRANRGRLGASRRDGVPPDAGPPGRS